MSRSKTRIHFLCDDELLRRLRAEAARLGVTVSDVIRLRLTGKITLTQVA